MKHFILKYKTKISILTFITIMLLTIGMVLINSQSYYAVYANGKKIGVVKQPRIAQQALQSLIKSMEKEYGQALIIDKPLAFKKISKTDSTLSIDALKKKLAQKISLNIKAVAINIDNNEQLIVKDKKTANQLINKVKNYYQSNDQAITKLAENIDFEEVIISPNEILSADKAFNLALKGRNSKEYEVKEGDTLWDLALKNSTSVDNIKRVNPEISENLQIGDEINIPDQPLINVVSTYTEEVVEKIPYKTVIKKNSSLSSGKSKIVKRGQNGKKKVKYEIVNKNGIEFYREAKSETIEKQAVNQVVEKGTRTTLVASRSGSGIFLKPTNGYISSRFGQRWGRMHKGIDIANDYGAPIVAAGNGKVIRVGWINGYGNSIDILHNNGLVTRYAHLSAYSVNTNTHVKSGQTIGKVGTSGNTTGPNLHFEVIKSGTPQNPANYL